MSVIKYFMPGCDYCKEFESEWNKIKAKFGDSAKEVNCVKEHEVCSNDHIQGVPSIHYNVNGNTFEHIFADAKDRTFENIDRAMTDLKIVPVFIPKSTSIFRFFKW
jgi:hypothetical protein